MRLLAQGGIPRALDYQEAKNGHRCQLARESRGSTMFFSVYLYEPGFQSFRMGGRAVARRR
jgi:hypothetical protein